MKKAKRKSSRKTGALAELEKETAEAPGAVHHAKKRGVKALLALISLFLLFYLFSQVNLQELSKVLAQAKIEWLLFALAASLAASLARVFRWKVLLDEKKKVNFWELIPIQLAGIAISNFTPGKVAEPFKIVFLKRFNFRYSFALLSVVWERLFDLVLLAVLSLGVVLGVGGDSEGLVVFALLALFFSTYVLHYHLQALTAWLAEFRFLAFLRGLETHKFSGLTLVGVALGTIVIWSLDFIAVWAAFASVGVGVDYLLLASAFSASVLLGIASLLPGGLGSTEAAFLFFLAPLGFAAPQVLAGVVLARLVTIAFSSSLGILLLPAAKR